MRKIIEVSNADVSAELEGKPLGDHLLEPTRIYVKPVLKMLETCDAHAISHITGGGFWENIPRVLPEGTKAVIDGNSWEWPAIFKWLQENGNVTQHEMYRTFNCGVGMVIVVAAEHAKITLEHLASTGINAWQLGDITNGAGGIEFSE